MPSALVTKLRKQPEVRDAEALAAWIGRYKKLRNAGVSNKKAMKLAGKEGGMKEGGVKKKDRKTGGNKEGIKAKADDQEVKDRIWERKNPENFGKPYLDKRTQDALREDPEKIDKLIGQQQEKIKGLESGRRRNRSEAEKDRVRTEANETIRSLEAFRRSLEGGNEKEEPQVSGYSGLTDADRKILAQARQRKSIAESYIKTYEGLLISGNEIGRARARDMLKELRKMFT